MNNNILMWTDGACSGNPGKGGWGVLIKKYNKIIKLSGSENNTTNNRMEMIAVIKGLENIPENSNIVIYTDSKYVKDGITNWIFKWKNNNWKNNSNGSRSIYCLACWQVKMEKRYIFK